MKGNIEIAETISGFQDIRLKEMDAVHFHNRMDTKYWFSSAQLPAILRAIQLEYFALDIQGQKMMPYTTTYFDTKDNDLYTAHHNGKLNRYKVRKRSYLSTGINFLEIKFKTNKGRTIKNRIKTVVANDLISPSELEFIDLYSSMNGDSLEPVVVNMFDRITLVHKDFKERCTIDLNINFKDDVGCIQMNNLAIIEIKSDGLPTDSYLAKALKKVGLRSTGFSKYCIGRAQLDNSLKRNNFKDNLLKLNKLIA